MQSNQTETDDPRSLDPMIRRTVHLEPEYFQRWPCENCSECGKPTRHWLTPHIPLCQDCAWSSPNNVI